MTTEERLERIEHVTAGAAEERRKDREESRQLWRDTQRQIHELTANLNALTLKVADTNDAITRLADESHQADQQLRDSIQETDARLGARIESLVSAIGRRLPAKPPQE